MQESLVLPTSWIHWPIPKILTFVHGLLDSSKSIIMLKVNLAATAPFMASLWGLINLWQPFWNGWGASMHHITLRAWCGISSLCWNPLMPLLIILCKMLIWMGLFESCLLPVITISKNSDKLSLSVLVGRGHTLWFIQWFMTKIISPNFVNKSIHWLQFNPWYTPYGAI